MVLKLGPWPSTNSPLTNSPYDGLMSTTERDSGAGAYSKVVMMHPRRSSSSRPRVPSSIQGEVVGAGVAPGRQPGALHEQVVEQGRGSEAEPVGDEPVGAGHLVDHDQVLDRVLAGADPACRLHADHRPGLLPVVADRLEHHQRDREGGCG